MDIIYTGFFVDRMNIESILETNGLEKPIDFPHVTTEFRPRKVDKTLFGKTVKVILNGYAINETNEGFRVSLETEDLQLQAEIDKIFANGSIPHITTSISANGKPVNTRYLDFKDIKPITITGVYGGFSKFGTPVFKL